MAQRMTLELDESRAAEILEQVKACVARVEPDCQILGI